MKLVLLQDTTAIPQNIKNLYAQWFSKEASNTKFPSASADDFLQERLLNSGRKFFILEDVGNILGFAELEIGSECFPDEDLPEICLKLHVFYVFPEKRQAGHGSAFFQLLKQWGHEQNASRIEMEVAACDHTLNKFLQKQGLELVGKGILNGYRSFI